MDIWRAAFRCPSDKPDAILSLGIHVIEAWTHCAPGAPLSLALRDGGHSIPKGWAQTAVDWFDALP